MKNLTEEYRKDFKKNCDTDNGIIGHINNMLGNKYSDNIFVSCVRQYQRNIFNFLAAKGKISKEIAEKISKEILKSNANSIERKNSVKIGIPKETWKIKHFLFHFMNVFLK